MQEFTEKYFYIVRHGETEFNRLSIVQGSGVDTDLNEKGVQQSKHFFEAYKNIPFDKIYTSELKRSQQSVQQFIDLGIPHEKLSDLNEISWGDIEGKPQTLEQQKMYWDVVNKWNNGEVSAKIPNGESPLEMQYRQTKAIHHILQNTAEKNVLICMHGRAMKSFLCLLLDMPLHKMEDFQHTNLCLYLLKYDGNKFELIKHNDVNHLKMETYH
jgi:probable phosphoglycerate mutase